MPIYEYQCDSCGHRLEALQKLSDTPLRNCPDCGKPKLRRLLSAPMFLLKGSGWYETDFKSDREAKRNLADRPEPEASKAEATAETKTETKVEPKAEPNKATQTENKAESGGKRTRTTMSKPGKRTASRRTGLSPPSPQPSPASGRGRRSRRRGA